MGTLLRVSLAILLGASIAEAGYAPPPTPQPTAVPPTPVPTATPQTIPTPVPTATAKPSSSLWISNTANNNVSTSGTQYMGVSGAQAANNTESIVDEFVSLTMSIQTFHCNTHTAPGAGTSYTMTVRKNAADTALVCTITDTATTCADNTHSVSLVDNDEIDIKIVPASSPAATPMHCSLVVVIP